MWNRVVLLTCGMVIGWGLANYWTCPPEDIPRHRYRITVGLLLALALCLWIAWDDPASGIIALSIVALTALVSYAGRARQISSLADRTTNVQVPEVSPGIGYAIILVSHALPRAYAGPEHWVRYLRVSRDVAAPDQGWFSRPRILERIRAGYQKLGAPPGSSQTLASVQAWLQAQLGPGTQLALAHPFATPRVERQLDALANQGCSAALVVPIDLNEASEAALQQQIALSQIEERGVQVVLLANARLDGWDERREFEQVDALSRGQPLPDNTGPAPERLEALAQVISEHMVLAARPGNKKSPDQHTPGGA
ncbi:MAG: hypothetical protein ACYCYF_11140 [Anaerolineae bacterium]